MDIGAWLRSLNLEQYAAVFQDNGVDTEILPELTEADLEKLGVLLGHRKRLLKAITALRDEQRLKPNISMLLEQSRLRRPSADS